MRNGNENVLENEIGNDLGKFRIEIENVNCKEIWDGSGMLYL